MFETSLMIITLPSDSRIHHTFLSYFPHMYANLLSSHYTSLLLHTLFINPKNSSISLCHSSEIKKKKKKRKRRKIKRKREIRSEKKENKWEISFTIISSTSTIYPNHHHPPHLGVFISGTFFVFKSTLFICIFSFNQVIPLEIVSFYFLQPPHTLHPKDMNPFELHSL